MTTPSDRFRHQFLMRLRDVISTGFHHPPKLRHRRSASRLLVGELLASVHRKQNPSLAAAGEGFCFGMRESRITFMRLVGSSWIC